MATDFIAQLMAMQLASMAAQQEEAERAARDAVARAARRRSAASERHRRIKEGRRAREAEDAELATKRIRHNATAEGQVWQLRSASLAQLDGPGRRRMLEAFASTEWAGRQTYTPSVDADSHVDLLQRRALECLAFPLEMWESLKAVVEEEQDAGATVVTVTIRSAEGLSGDGGILSKLNPYCEVTVSGAQRMPVYRTSVKKRAKAPVWEESFRFGLLPPDDDTPVTEGRSIEITVRNLRLLHADNELAFIRIPVTDDRLSSGSAASAGAGGAPGAQPFLRGTGSIRVSVSVSDSAEVADRRRDVASITEPYHAGAVLKRARATSVFGSAGRSGRDHWSDRYLILKGDTLAWWKSEKDACIPGRPPRKTLTMTTKTRVSDSHLRELTLKVYNNEEDYLVLQTPNATEKEEWLSKLRSAVRSLSLPTLLPDCLDMVSALCAHASDNSVGRVLRLVRTVALKAQAALTEEVRDTFPTFLRAASDLRFDVMGALPEPGANVMNSRSATWLLVSMATLACRYLVALGEAGAAPVEAGALPNAPYCVYLTSSTFVELLRLLARFAAPLAQVAGARPPMQDGGDTNAAAHSRLCLMSVLLLLRANVRAAADLRIDADQLNRPVSVPGLASERSSSRSASRAVSISYEASWSSSEAPSVISCTLRLLLRLIACSSSADSEIDIQAAAAQTIADGLPLLVPVAERQAALLFDALQCEAMKTRDAGVARGYRLLLLAMAKRLQNWGAISHLVFPQDDVTSTARRYHQSSAERVFRSLRLEQLVRRIPAARLGLGVRRGRSALSPRGALTRSVSGHDSDDDFAGVVARRASSVSAVTSTGSDGASTGAGGASESKGLDGGAVVKSRTGGTIDPVAPAARGGAGGDGALAALAGPGAGTDKDEAREEAERVAAAKMIQRAYLNHLDRVRAEEEDVDPIALLGDRLFVDTIFQLLRQGDGKPAVQRSDDNQSDSQEASPPERLSIFASVYGAAMSTTGAESSGAARAPEPPEGPIHDNRVIGFVKWASSAGAAAPSSLAHVVAAAKRRRLASVPVEIDTLQEEALQPHGVVLELGEERGGEARVSAISVTFHDVGIRGAVAEQVLAELFRAALGVSGSVASDPQVATAAAVVLLNVERDLLSRGIVCEGRALRHKPVIQALSTFGQRILGGFHHALDAAASDADALDRVAGLHFLFLAPLLSVLPSLKVHTGLTLDMTPVLNKLWTTIETTGVNKWTCTTCGRRNDVAAVRCGGCRKARDRGGNGSPSPSSTRRRGTLLSVRTPPVSESGAQNVHDFGADFSKWFAKLASAADMVDVARDAVAGGAAGGAGRPSPAAVAARIRRNGSASVVAALNWTNMVAGARDVGLTTSRLWRAEGWSIICGATSTLLSSFAGGLVAGGHDLSLAEASLARWLSSDLMAGGLGTVDLSTLSASSSSEELRHTIAAIGTSASDGLVETGSTLPAEQRAFLAAVIDNVDDGAAINKYMEKKAAVCNPMARRMGGGVKFDRGCRAAVAACLYMTDLTSQALEAAKCIAAGEPPPVDLDDKDGPFVSLWRHCCSGMRKWAKGRKLVEERNYSDGGTTGAAGARAIADRIWSRLATEVSGRAYVVLSLKQVDVEEAVRAARAAEAAAGSGEALNALDPDEDLDDGTLGDVAIAAVRSSGSRSRREKPRVWSRIKSGMLGRREISVDHDAYFDGEDDAAEEAPTVPVLGREMSAMSADVAGVDVLDTVSKTVCLFLQSATPSQEARAVLRQVARRAVCRFYGLKVYQALLKPYVDVAAAVESGDTLSSELSLGYEPVLDSLLSTLLFAFRELPLPAGSVQHHYLDHVRAAGAQAVGAISGTVRAILVTLVQMLNGPVSRPSTAILILDALRFNYRPTEQAFLLRSGVIDAVRRLMHGEVPATWRIEATVKVRQVAALLFQSVVLSSFQVAGISAFAAPAAAQETAIDSDSEDEAAVDAAASALQQVKKLSAFQSHVLEVIYEDLTAIARGASWAASDAASVDFLALHLLSLLGTLCARQSPPLGLAKRFFCSRAAAVRDRLGSKEWSETLLSLAGGGVATGDERHELSPQTRQVALRLVCVAIVPTPPSKVVVPDTLAKAGTGATASTTRTAGKTLPRVLLELCGRLLSGYHENSKDAAGGAGVAAASTTSRLPPSTVTWHQVLAFEICVVLRRMLQSEHWGAPAGAAMGAIMKDAAALWKAHSNSSDAHEKFHKAASLFAVLSALSSSAERVVEGARVRVTRSAGEDFGSVVAVGDSTSHSKGLRSNEALVVLDSVSPRRPVVVSVAQLRCIPAQGVDIDLSSLPMKQWIVPLATAIVKESSASGASSTAFAEEMPALWGLIRSRALMIFADCLSRLPGATGWVGGLLPRLASISARPAQVALTGKLEELDRRSLDAAAALIAATGGLHHQLPELEAPASRPDWSTRFATMEEVNALLERPATRDNAIDDFKEQDAEEVELGLIDKPGSRLDAAALDSMERAATNPFAGVPDDQWLLDSAGVVVQDDASMGGTALGKDASVAETLLHLAGVESYVTVAACRRATLAVLNDRLRDGSFKIKDIGTVADTIAIVKLAAAQQNRGDDSGVVWDVLHRLLALGATELTRGLVDEVLRFLATERSTFRLVDSLHPVPDTGTMLSRVNRASVDGASALVCEFDRRTVVSDFFLPNFEIKVFPGNRAGDSSAGGRTLGTLDKPSMFGCDTTPIVLADSTAAVSQQWKPIAPGKTRKTLPPLWGFRLRVRPVAWAGMDDIGVLAAPLGWKLLRLLTGSAAGRQAVMSAPNSVQLFQMLVRYLLTAGAPHKAFTTRCLCLLLQQHRSCGSSALRGEEDGAAPASAGPAPSWPLAELATLYDSLIQRVYDWMLRLGIWTSSPYFRALLDLCLYARNVLRVTEFYWEQSDDDRGWFDKKIQVSQMLAAVAGSAPMPREVVTEALEKVTSDYDLVRTMLLSAESNVASDAQEFTEFSREQWLLTVHVARTTSDLFKAIQYYERPLKGAAFQWTTEDYRAWCNSAQPESLAGIASHLLELQTHIKPEAMSPQWESKKRDFEAALRGVASATGETAVASVEQLMEPWPQNMWEVLTSYSERLFARGGRLPDSIVPRDIKERDAELDNFPALASVETPVLRGRFVLLRHFNRRVLELLSITDTTFTAFQQDVPVPDSDARAEAAPTCVEWSHGGQLVQLKNALFMATKMAAFNNLMEKRYNLVAASDDGLMEILVNRVQANEAKAQLTALVEANHGARGGGVTGGTAAAGGAGGPVGATLARGASASTIDEDHGPIADREAAVAMDREELERNTFWGQLYEQLEGAPPDKLRRRDQQFKVRYAGEGGHDVGGLYRDLLTNATEELLSPLLSLFVMPENGEPGKWVPSPDASSPAQLSQFEVIGLIMGYQCLSLSNTVGLVLNRVVWKRLVGEQPTSDDVRALNDGVAEMISFLDSAGASDGTMTDDVLESCLSGATFSARTYSGETRDLIVGGRTERVTAMNVGEYVQAMRRFTVAQCDRQIAAIRTGIGRMIPLRMLPLFSWQEMERLVVGISDIDVETLQRKTQYRGGLSESDPHIRMFWEVLRDDFSVEDRQQFLKFTWGRTSLPATETDWGSHTLKLTPHQRSEEALRTGGAAAAAIVDQSFPVAHTCFFQLELPKYSRREVLRDKLLFAQRNCAGIDYDDTAEGRANAELAM